MGDAVHLRGLIEVSSHCRRQCMYCGLRKGNRDLERYRMTRNEIEECSRMAVELGYGTVVIQAGEDDELTAEWIAEIVGWIKRSTPLAVPLSLGERSEKELRLWREAGADRYLLRFETSDTELFRAIHPSGSPTAPDRLALLQQIKLLGYEAGGGVMVGIPGQSYQSLAHDVLTFRALDLDMIGIRALHPATRPRRLVQGCFVRVACQSGRPGAGERTNGLQDDRPHTHSLSGGEYSQHYSARYD